MSEPEVVTLSQDRGSNKMLKLKFYLAHCLSTVGDNMWFFAGGLYMIEIDPSSLRLTAAYGFVVAMSVICFGAILGKWIDRSGRLTACAWCLFVQNLSVALCAAILSLYLAFGISVDDTGFPWRSLVIVSSFLLSAVSNLASSGSVIVLQKDWIVVIAGDDNDFLADMNSILRTIGLTTYMVAPAVAGLLFQHIGYIWTGACIAGWNVTSAIVEFAILANIYNNSPTLQAKKFLKEEEEVVEEDTNDKKAGENIPESPRKEVGNGGLYSDAPDLPDSPRKTKKEPDINGVMTKALGPLKDLYYGWKAYFTHPVRNAGLGLALLYMTVLGFDNITYGFVLTQGIPEGILGILVAVSALIGIFGSIVYPLLRRRVGLERTGLLGMFFLVSTSSLAVVSVFLSGSPFLNYDFVPKNANATITNVSVAREVDDYSSITVMTEDDDYDVDELIILGQRFKDIFSVCVLLVGITLARFGLWICDLSITQIMQEGVEEEIRGAVNGVQNSLNNFLDLLKCILVILFPHPYHFGALIFLSFSSISLGWLSYATYSHQQRGHILPFHSLCGLHHQNMGFHPRELHRVVVELQDQGRDGVGEEQLTPRGEANKSYCNA